MKYIADSSVYVDAGRNADLQEGMKLSVIEPPPDNAVSDGLRFRGYPHVAELNVISVADSSSVCDVISTSGELKIGQFAFLSPNSAEDRHLAENAREAENYPIVVAFTSGDPVDEEMRATKVENITESPIGVMRARVGFSYGGIRESGMNSSQVGMMIDADMTHIGGTYWNFNGYWRGNLSTSSSSVPGAGTSTLTDLINRTYHLGFTYQNPYSPNTYGIGRLFLPWAPSLSTIDGAYMGHRIGHITTVGAFAGSTPDPSSWSYNPNQQIAGTFVSVENGDFDHVHYLSTAGIALNTIDFRVSRQFAFFENNMNWKRYIAFYNSMQFDTARTSPYVNGGSNPTGITQTYNSLHFQPIKLITFGVNYNYFRNLPTFDPLLIGTGLVDKYLFQGFSGDVRLDLPKHISLYADLGRSKASTDTQHSLNQDYGITFTNIGRTGLLLDLHYSQFNSSFGSGEYESVSVSKSLSDALHVQLLAGNQKFNSPFSSNTNAKFVNGIVDWTIGRRYFVEGLIGLYNGTTLNYTQWSATLGYRFGGLRK
ncbi:MAG TPA: hypothetical protein VJX70_00295 [Candidatus Acidoferrum sp.]|nr:hypothetical protein [Candidatus Acidoferrum sp.]